MGLQTGKVKVENIVGGGDTGLLLFADKAFMGGAVGDKYGVTEEAKGFGLLVFIDAGGTDATLEELTGDVDTGGEDDVMLSMEAVAAPGLVVGEEYDCVKVGTTLLVLIPGPAPVPGPATPEPTPAA